LKIAYFYDTIDDHHIFLACYIFHASEGTADDAYEGNDSVSQFGALEIKKVKQEIKLFRLLYLEKIVSDELIDQILPQLRRNLQCVDSKTQ
jgi:hypothetical protein